MDGVESRVSQGASQGGGRGGQRPRRAPEGKVCDAERRRLPHKEAAGAGRVMWGPKRAVGRPKAGEGA